MDDVAPRPTLHPRHEQMFPKLTPEEIARHLLGRTKVEGVG